MSKKVKIDEYELEQMREAVDKLGNFSTTRWNILQKMCKEYDYKDSISWLDNESSYKCEEPFHAIQTLVYRLHHLEQILAKKGLLECPRCHQLIKSKSKKKEKT